MMGRNRGFICDITVTYGMKKTNFILLFMRLVIVSLIVIEN